MAATNDVEWLQYTNPVLGVSLQYPATWGFEESPSVGIVVFAEAETLKKQALTPLSPVINLITQKLPGITLEEFSEQQLQRMREMTGGDIKVDKDAKLGDIPAHKAISMLAMPGGPALKFFSMWAYSNDIGYSFFFHSTAPEFNKFGPALTTMLKSFRSVRSLSQSYPLASYHNDSFVFRYPASWKTQKTEGEKAPLLVATLEEQFKTEKLTTSLRLLSIAKKGPLSTHVDLLKVQLERMHVEEVEIVSTMVGKKEARVATYASDASGTMMRYFHLLTTEDDAETTPVISMTVTTNAAKDEYDQLPAIFHQIRSSFVFLSDSEEVRKFAAYGGYYHLKFEFGFLYDLAKYKYRTEGIPLTEASFSRVGDDEQNPLVNFSVIVREIAEGEKPDLLAMGDELQENLKGVCGNTLEKIVNEATTLCGHPGRVLVFHGSAASPVNPSEVEEMYFAYKYVINMEKKTALLFAFASIPKEWQAEWKVVESYLDTLYWASS